MVVAKVVTTMQTKTPTKAATESTMDPYWGRQTFQYKTEEPPVPPEEKKPVDTITPELAALRRQMTALQQELELLKQRKTTTTVVNQGDKGGQRPAGGPRAHAVHFACGAERRRRRDQWRAGLRVGTRDLPAVRGRDEDE